MKSGIYPSTLTNVCFWKMIEFYKGKRDCKAIVLAAWGLGHSPGGLSEAIASNAFGFLMSLGNRTAYNGIKKAIFMA